MPFYLYIFPAKTVLPSLQDGIWLLILSWICTIVAMYLSLEALKKISVFTQNLTLNLEPVYGIILAMILFKENKELSPSFYIGLSLIIAAVIIQILLLKTKKVH
jgi:drug/metabolite transporter (DMT)-like permease